MIQQGSTNSSEWYHEVERKQMSSPAVSSQLSDIDLVEVLRMRKARKGGEGRGSAEQD